MNAPSFHAQPDVPSVRSQVRDRVKNPVVPAMEKKAYRPPFWESKVYGEPYGDFNRRPPPRAVVRVAKPAPGRPTLNLNGDPVARRSVRDLDASSALAAARARSDFNRLVHVRDDPRAADAAYTRVASCPTLPGVERDMRAALRAARALHKGERDILIDAFRALDPPDARGERTGTVDPAAFVSAWDSLGVRVTPVEAVAAFNKYGQTRDGRLPYATFAEALLVAPARFTNMSTEVRRGAFVAGESAAFQGKIIYHPCRKGVFTPTGWTGAPAARSAARPDATLELEHVHGYARDSLACNLFYTSRANTVVYYTAAIGIVYDASANAQRFFRGHDDDVRCLCVNATRDLCATGQVGREPVVCVWDPETCEERARLRLPAVRGVAAVGFCRESKLLACVGMDNNHTIFVYDWAKNRRLHELKGHTDVPPKVYGLIFDPHGPDPSAFLTYGVNHVKRWTKSAESGRYVEDSGRFGPAAKKHAVCAAAFLPGGRVLTGTPEGSIAVWTADGKCARIVRAHAPGPTVRRADGSPTHHGARCLRLSPDGKTLYSAGADGHVIRWDVSDGDLRESNVLGATPVRCESARDATRDAAAPMFRGLDVDPDFERGGARLVAGTTASEIWEVTLGSASGSASGSGSGPGSSGPGSKSASASNALPRALSRVLARGHSSDLYGVAWNPARPSEYATASEGERVRVWCAERRVMVRSVHIGNKGRCVAFSPDGRLLAVGCARGGVHVLDAESLVRTRWIKTLDGVVTDVKFSPDGRYLVAASQERCADVYDCERGYKKISRCAGHSAAVKHADWSEDGRALRTSCGAYEILHFDPKTGRQIQANQRDTTWATRTSPLGFDVMGVWPPGADGTDVNACDVSAARRHLVAADDFGGVNVMNYPCVVDEAPRQRCAGHSSHVMNARFSPEDEWVVSVGGMDRSVFQWRFREAAPKKPNLDVPPWEREVEARGVKKRWRRRSRGWRGRRGRRRQR